MTNLPIFPGILGKKLKQMFCQSKEFTLDSMWIEEELKQLIRKEEENDCRKSL